MAKKKLTKEDVAKLLSDPSVDTRADMAPRLPGTSMPMR